MIAVSAYIDDHDMDRLDQKNIRKQIKVFSKYFSGQISTPKNLRFGGEFTPTYPSKKEAFIRIRDKLTEIIETRQCSSANFNVYNVSDKDFDKIRSKCPVINLTRSSISFHTLVQSVMREDMGSWERLCEERGISPIANHEDDNAWYNCSYEGVPLMTTECPGCSNGHTSFTRTKKEQKVFDKAVNDLLSSKKVA
jgi:hypothetical protein